MFLLVSVRHVGAHPDELQHGVSIQSSINLGKTFPRISRIRIIPSTQILAMVVVYLPPFISQILDIICRMVLIFILIYFEWRDVENQQYLLKNSSWVWHEVIKIQTKKLSPLLSFFFHVILEHLEIFIQTNFRFKRVLCFAIPDAWISRVLSDAAISWWLGKLLCGLKTLQIFGDFAI